MLWILSVVNLMSHGVLHASAPLFVEPSSVKSMSFFVVTNEDEIPREISLRSSEEVLFKAVIQPKLKIIFMYDVSRYPVTFRYQRKFQGGEQRFSAYGNYVALSSEGFSSLAKDRSGLGVDLGGDDIQIFIYYDFEELEEGGGRLLDLTAISEN